MFFSYFLQKLTFALIWIYQKTISFDHGLMQSLAPHGKCKFYPSCSEYTRGAMLKYGLFKGTLLTIKRLLRCNPWTKGGIDEP